MFKINMVEPRRWYDFLLYLVKLWEENPRLEKFYPIGADVFVFIYPVFLLAIYIYWMVKQKIEQKKEAIFIFIACLFSIAANILSQQFFDKKRPIYELWIKDFDETILHNFLPSTSFPSDHAVVTFSVAMWTWLIAHKHKNKKLTRWSYFLFLIAIITVLCRIWTKVHRTTDILAGSIMGLLVPIILAIPACYKFIEKRIIIPIINLEERIVKKIFKSYKKSS